jgi:hypothetical protein
MHATYEGSFSSGIQQQQQRLTTVNIMVKARVCRAGYWCLFITGSTVVVLAVEILQGSTKSTHTHTHAVAAAEGVIDIGEEPVERER